MKKLIILLICLYNTTPIFSQKELFCEDEISLVMSGNYYDYELALPNCTKEVQITTIDENTVISGITLISPVNTLRIVASEGYRINIKPKEATDIIDLLSVDHLIVDTRDTLGNTDTEDKFGVVIYPNPVTTYLYIKMNETLESYQIKNMYNVPQLQGSVLTDDSINVGDLEPGIYYLILKTQSKLIIKSFIKN